MDGGISGRATDKLSDRRVKAFTKTAAPGAKLFDGGGMFLFVTTAGSPIWRLKYRFEGKERLYVIGEYPTVSLEVARRERDRVKHGLKGGEDPVVMRRVAKRETVDAIGTTFAAVAAEWLAKEKPGWSVSHYTKSKRALERDIFPAIGKLPVSHIQPAMVASAIEAIVKRGAVVTAANILNHTRDVFSYARAKGKLKGPNPADDAHHVVPAPDTDSHPALLTWPELGDVLRRAETARVSPAVRLAHRLAAFTAARIGNIVRAQWDEFDLDADVPTWTIPRRQMKVKKSKQRRHDHVIILGATIAAELRQWQALVGGKGYVFASASKKGHITPDGLEKFYRETLKLRDKHSPHGWRASFSTLAKDNHKDKDAVNIALDHLHTGEVQGRYDRGDRRPLRIELARWWDERLMEAQRGADVVKMPRKTA